MKLGDVWDIYEFDRRAPHGARELKRGVEGGLQLVDCRAPHGARELKPAAGDREHLLALSRPPRGA